MRLPVCFLNCKENYKPSSRLQIAACIIRHRRREIEGNFISLSSNILREVKVADVILYVCTVCVINVETLELI
jgi:hypothetical protein